MSHGGPRVKIIHAGPKPPPSWKKCFLAGLVLYVVLHYVIICFLVLTHRVPL